MTHLQVKFLHVNIDYNNRNYCCHIL